MLMKMPDPINASAIVHIVDDDPGLRRSLDGLLRASGYTPLQHGSVDEFLACEMLDQPGCIVLDVQLPGMSGIDFQARLRELDLSLPVILMSGFGDVPMTVQGMKQGAVDFLPKPFHPGDLISAVVAALARDGVERACRAHLSRLRERWAELSPREQQVMVLVAAGRLNKQIAFELRISEVTVKAHRGSGMRKLGARTIVEFVKMAGDLGLAV